MQEAKLITLVLPEELHTGDVEAQGPASEIRGVEIAFASSGEDNDEAVLLVSADSSTFALVVVELIAVAAS